MPAPYDYASTLGGATGITPAVQGAVLGQQNIQGNALTLDAQALQNQLAQKAADRQQAMQADFATLANNPTAAGYAHFMTLYPEQHDALGKAWDALDKRSRDSTLRTVSDVYGRLQSGDVEGAIAQLQAHADAGGAAGEDVSNYPALITAIREDPKKGAALAGYALASAVGPDKFGDMFGKLNPTDKETTVQKEYDWRVSQFGKAAADNWLSTQDTKFIPVQAGGQVFAAGGASGGTVEGTQALASPAPAGVTVTPTGPAIEHAALAAVPGAVVTSGLRTAEHNREVGGVRNSFHLTDQARDFVPPKGMPMKMLHAKLKTALPGFDVLDEGTHVHVEPGPGIAAHAGPVKVNSPTMAQGLAKGTHYVTPDGREFVR